MFKKIVLLKLKFIAKIIIWRHKPKIIGITGSVGKTTTKDVILKVLGKDFEIYATKKSMNSEWGLPLTILRQGTPDNLRSFFLWEKIFLNGLKQLFKKDYPKVLVLEYGVEKPKDMDYLLSITKPQISIITGIAETHLDSLKSLENIVSEKKKIITENSKVILNTDFVHLRELARKISNKKLTYGFNCFLSDEENCITATDIQNDLKGLRFKLCFRGESYNLKTKLFGEHSVYALLAAFAVGIFMDMGPKKIIERLETVEASPGRMKALRGINGSIIIDDSYNSSPQAAIKAIEAVEEFKGKRRLILVLGSMNELGDFTEEAHRKVGIKAGEVADILVTVGEVAEKWLAWSAKGKGLTQVYSFKDPFSAGEFLKDRIQKDDLILVKGSQNGIYTEEVTKILLDSKYDPRKTLVRQTDDWMSKKLKLKVKN